MPAGRSVDEPQLKGSIAMVRPLVDGAVAAGSAGAVYAVGGKLGNSSANAIDSDHGREKAEGLVREVMGVRKSERAREHWSPVGRVRHGSVRVGGAQALAGPEFVAGTVP